MKVWIVEHGEYSNRYVSGVYSTEEYAKIAAGDDGDVTECELDEGISRYQSGLRTFRVEMGKDGAVRKVDQWGFKADDSNEFRLWVFSQHVGGNRLDWNQLNATVWAHDEQHAIKITNEHRAQLIASGEWDRQQEEEDKKFQVGEAQRIAFCKQEGLAY